MLTDALRDEAQERDVDVTRLWAQTRTRLGEQDDAAGQDARRRRLTILATAAAVAVTVTAGGVAITRTDAGPDPASPNGSTAPVEGGVDDDFTCPEQITHDWTRPKTVTDEYYVASLEGGPRAQARTHDAPRYEYAEQGDRAFLRFGNADGSLATLSEFRRVDGGWRRYRTDVCVGENGNVAAPVEHEWDLGNHGGDPYEAGAELFGRRKPVYVVDDRPYYDRIGLVRHRSIWATRCAEALCLTSGVPESWRRVKERPGVVPHDVSQLFLSSDEMPGRKNPYGLWVVYDVEGTVASLQAYRKDGAPVTDVGAHVDGWPGQLHILLAPFDQVVKLTVTRLPGTTAAGEPRTQSFRPQDLPGYGARDHR